MRKLSGSTWPNLYLPKYAVNRKLEGGRGINIDWPLFVSDGHSLPIRGQVTLQKARHLHPEIPFITTGPKIKNANSQSFSPAPLKIRDAVFRKFVRLSPASNYMEELVTGPGGLLSRGIEDHATSYGALARTKRGRATLAGILNDYVSARFPAYAQSHSAADVVAYRDSGRNSLAWSTFGNRATTSRRFWLYLIKMTD